FNWVKPLLRGRNRNARTPSRVVLALVLGGSLALSACVQSGARTGGPSTPEPPPPTAQPTTPVESEPLEGAGPLLGPEAGNLSRVALLVPLSGNGASVGQSIKKAAEMAAFDIGSENFVLQPYDTRGTPAGAAEAARTALAQGAKLILGPLFGDSVRTVAPLAAQRGVNVIAFSTDETVAGGNVYLSGFLFADQVERILTYAKQNARNSVAVLAPANAFGYAVAGATRQIAPQLGMSMSGEEFYDPNNADNSAVVQQILARPFDTLILPDQGLSLKAVASLLPYYGLDPQKVMVAGTMLWGQDRSLANEASLDGAVFPTVSPNAKANFETRYRSNFGEDPSELAGLGYDATALAALLDRNAGGQDVYSAATLQAPTGFSGVYGIFRFRNNGTVDRGLALMRINPSAAGGIETVEPAPSSFAPRPGS
ncbi:MAG: penicillin-binding protein activator, partial [Rhodospirillaceae bacterium]